MQYCGASIATPAGSCASGRTSRTSVVTWFTGQVAAGLSTMTMARRSLPDDVGYHFADERFLVGEYVSLNEGGKMHTYRVTSASYL